MDNLPNKPKIKDMWYVIPTDNYVLFRGKEIFKIEGKNFKEFLEVMLPLLRGDHSLKEILSILSEYNREDLITALSMLNKQGILEDTSVKIPKNLSRNGLKDFRGNLEYFSRFSENKYQAQLNLKKSQVAILGAGTLGCSIASSLASSGVGRILLIDNEVKTKRIEGLNGINRKALNDRIKVKTWDNKTGESDISGLSERYNLLICATDSYEPSLFNLVNRVCLENGIPWISVYFLEEEGVIGPFTVSREGSCFNCFQIRLLNNSEHIEEDKALNDYLSENGRGEKIAIPRFYCDIISNFAVLEIINFLSKVGTPSTLGNVYVQNFKTLSGELHRVIKVPGCPVCNGRAKDKPSINTLMSKEKGKWDRLFKEKASDGNISPLIQEVEKLVDERTGIIRKSTQANKYLNLFSTYGWLATGSFPDRFHNLYGIVNKGGGTEDTYEEARCSALVEAVERYCCRSQDEKNIIRTTYREAQKHAINPKDVVLFSENQYSQKNFPWKRFCEDSPIGWIPGFNLIKKEPVLVPADFVYLGSSQDRLCAETNNGAAAHSSRIEAILGGIFEIVERDGLMIMWFNRLSMPKISIDSLPLEIRGIIKKINDFGFDVIVQNITTDIGVPAFCVFLVNKLNKKPALFSGAGCNLNPRIAIMKALREALRAFTYHLEYPKRAEQIKIPSFVELRDPIDHGNLYFDPEMLKHLDFIIESKGYQNLDEVKDLRTKDPLSDLEYCLSRFGKKKMDVIAVDLTSPDIVNTGLYVVRVIIPGMQPMSFGMRNQRLGGIRLYDVPKKLGYTKLSTGEKDLNMIPHFFA